MNNEVTMLKELQYRERNGQTIQVGLVGAGAMGLGIALQIKQTPGMALSFIADLDSSAAERAQAAYGQKVPLYQDAKKALEDTSLKLDVLVESTNTISSAAEYCLLAIQRKAHVVLMNAEVDLMLGHYLNSEAQKAGVIVTSDAGDQHGVLMRMMEEIQLWGFDIAQAGNIKGFLDRYATAESKREIAKQLNLSLTQCVAYTDGSKLNIEMAVLANGTDLSISQRGMQGPKVKQVTDVFNHFDFSSYDGQGHVDYILGAEPGGGVYVIGYNEDPLQAGYMKYYKVQSKGPFYLFYRPYHLCHIETPYAIARAVIQHDALLKPNGLPKTDVYGFAKSDLTKGSQFHHGFGDDWAYGLIETATTAAAQNLIPLGLLSSENEDKPRLRNALEKDAPITWSDVDLPETKLLRLYKKQQQLNEIKATETV